MFLLSLQILIIFLVPFLLTRLTHRLGTQNWLPPVVLCYVVGIGLRNLTSWPLDDAVSSMFSQGTILLAIPLLLYSTDLLGWLRLAKKTVVGFLLMMLAVVAAVLCMAVFFEKILPDTWLLSGMLTGIYIGGTPNLNAVGLALNASEETIVLLNAAEIACGGAYLIFLTSVAHRFFGLFLSDFSSNGTGPAPAPPDQKLHWPDVLRALLLTVLLAGTAAGLTYLFTGGVRQLGVILLLLSALGVGASFFPKIRNLNGSFEAGEYLLLMFCVAIGLLADFSEIFANGGWYVAFAGSVLLVAVVFHVLLCRWFGIDRDTMMITQTAGFYGPPFIGQVAAVIKNRSLVFSGIATGLVGLAIANFIGVAVAKLVQWLG